MIDVVLAYLVKNYPSIVVVAIISGAFLNYIWNKKKKIRVSKLTTKAIFITGCDSGVGWECARRLDKIGFHVFAGCILPEDDGAKRLKAKTSSNLHIVKIDVTDEEQVRKAAEYVKSNLPFGAKGLFCLINGVSSMLHGDFDWYTTEQCQRLIDINVTGTVRVTKYFLPLLRTASGRIINISSITAQYGFPQLSMYGATMWAIKGLSNALRNELHYLGIKVSVFEVEDNTCATIKPMLKSDIDEMWERMDAEGKELYGDNFQTWKLKMEKVIRRDCRIAREVLKRLLNDIENSLLSNSPKDTYVVVSTSFNLILSLFNLLPEYYKSKVIQIFTQKDQPVECLKHSHLK